MRSVVVCRGCTVQIVLHFVGVEFCDKRVTKYSYAPIIIDASSIHGHFCRPELFFFFFFLERGASVAYGKGLSSVQ
jgi:hypothetical protein